MTEATHAHLRELCDNIATRVGNLANEIHRPELIEPDMLATHAEAAADQLLMLAGWLRDVAPKV
jgi:hypothetical protein